VTSKRASRVMGLLLIVQLAGLIVPFVMLRPLGRDFLATAAPAAGSIRTAVIALFANGGLTIGLSFMGARVLRRNRDAGSFWLVSAAVIMCVLQAVDSACILSMLAVSDRFVSTTPPDEALRVAGDVLRTIRQWTHTMAILAIDVWIASLYVLLHCRRAVPRALTAFGLITVGLHFVGIPLRSVLGYGPLGTLGMPMALGHLALAAWLLARGVTDVAPGTAKAPAMPV
jgi:Domain of unknown function (DUF4386)